MENKSENRKRFLLKAFAAILTACLLCLGLYIFVILDQYYGKIETSGEDSYGYRNGGRPEYLVDGKWYVQKSKVETFLFIGIDKYEAAIRNQHGYRNTEQSDALFLLAVNHENDTYSIIHINRDTMAKIRMLDLNGDPYNDYEGQLALSHTYGSGREDSCENTVWSVSDYLYGLQIDHYASVSMDAVSVLNDDIGGVKLTVSDDMTAVDATLVKDTEVTLHGEQALTYVRARKELPDATNLNRMKRQRQYVNAFIEQSRKAIDKDNSLASDMILSVSDYLVSDMTAQELLALTDVLHNDDFTGIKTIDGEARMGERYIEFRAEETALQKLVLDTFYDLK